MLLAIDIGNTNVAIGAFEGDQLKATWRLATDPRRLSDQYGLELHGLLPLKGVTISEIEGCALCSVVPTLTPAFEEVCRSLFGVEPLVVGTGTKTGVRVLYDNPRDVGADRIVDAAAAFQLYGGPTIIVDFGTATVFDAVSGQGEYLGGAIAPGILIAAESLVQNTSQLRRVELVRPKRVVGTNTIASLQAGLFYGYVSLVEGMVARFKEDLGSDARVVATGGQASLIAQDTEVFDYVNPDLTLLGLRQIYDLNQG
ncbi:MAG: type III pantothenate kinase [Chloroflexi bacterium]|jgi:type III pantothenate kinase|nr:MAG: type III pantothenate kinase [Chloroflexota bacterium]